MYLSHKSFPIFYGLFFDNFFFFDLLKIFFIQSFSLHLSFFITLWFVEFRFKGYFRWKCIFAKIKIRFSLENTRIYPLQFPSDFFSFRIIFLHENYCNFTTLQVYYNFCLTSKHGMVDNDFFLTPNSYLENSFMLSNLMWSLNSLLYLLKSAYLFFVWNVK